MNEAERKQLVDEWLQSNEYKREQLGRYEAPHQRQTAPLQNLPSGSPLEADETHQSDFGNNLDLNSADQAIGRNKGTTSSGGRIWIWPEKRIELEQKIRAYEKIQNS